MKSGEQQSSRKRYPGTEQKQGSGVAGFIEGTADKETHGEPEAIGDGIVQSLAKGFIRSRSELIHVKDTGHMKGTISDRMENLTGQNHHRRLGNIQDGPPYRRPIT